MIICIILSHFITIFDFIWKKIDKLGTIYTGPDYMQRVMRSVWSEPTIFVAHEHLQKSFFVSPYAMSTMNAITNMRKKADLWQHCLFLQRPGFHI